MKKLILLFAFFSVTVFSQITLVPAGTNGAILGPNGGPLPAVDTTNAKLLTVHLSEQYGKATLTDVLTGCPSPCNSGWIKLTEEYNSGAPAPDGNSLGTAFWYCTTCKVGTNHVVTLGGAGQYSTGEIESFSSPNRIIFDQQNTKFVSTANPLYAYPITPAVANELFIVGLSGTTPPFVYNNIDSGFTITNQEPGTNGNNYSGMMAYLIATDALSHSANISYTGGSGVFVTSMIAFRESAGVSTISVSPSSLVTNTTGNIIAITGVNTTWVAGTPGVPNFSITGGTGAAITSQSVTNNTSASLTLNSGSSAGTIVITDPSSGATANITTTAANPLISMSASRTIALSVTLSGTSTAWTPGTPGIPIFSMTGGTGASINSQVINSANSAAFTINVGSTVGGFFTITDPSTSKTATVAMPVGGAAIPSIIVFQ